MASENVPVPFAADGPSNLRDRGLMSWRAALARFWIQDLTVKYNRSFLGVAWSLLNPALMLGVISLAFSFAFGRDDAPGYTLHLLSTLLPWMIFSQAVSEGSASIVAGEPMLRQFPIPKLIFPLRRVLFRTSEGLLSLTALFAVAQFLDFSATPALLVIPLAVFDLFAVSLGFAALGAVAVVYFRDIEHLISVGTRAWFYLTPIIVPFQSIPPEYQPWFAMNPMYYVLELFDAPIARGEWPTDEVMGIATAFSLATALAGCALVRLFDRRLIFRL